MEDPLNHTVRASVMIKLMTPAHMRVQVIIDTRRDFILSLLLYLTTHRAAPRTEAILQCPLHYTPDTGCGTQARFHHRADIENGQYQT